MKAIAHTSALIALIIAAMATAAYLEKVRPQDELVEYLYLAKGERTRKFALGFNGEYADILWTLSIQSFHKGLLSGTSSFRADSIANHFKDPDALAEKFRNQEDPLSEYLFSQFSEFTKILIQNYDDPDGLTAFLETHPDSHYLRRQFPYVTRVLMDHYAHTKEFMHILHTEKEFLLKADIKEPVDNSNIATHVLKLFEMHHKTLSPYAQIAVEDEGVRWRIEDPGERRRYLIAREGETLSVYELKTPLHPYLSRKVDRDASSLQESLLSDLQVALKNDMQQAMAADLNRIIERENFYRPELFAHIEIPADILELLRERPKGKDVVRLNRLLLETAYPHEILRSPYFKNIAAVFDLITDLDPYFQGVYAQAPIFLLVVKDPLAAIEMLEKGTRKEEIRDQPWIWYLLGRMYLSERFYMARFRPDDFRDFRSLDKFIKKLRLAEDPVSRYLNREFALETLRALDNYDGSEEMAQHILPMLIIELNRLVTGPSLHEQFSEIAGAVAVGAHCQSRVFSEAFKVRTLRNELRRLDYGSLRSPLVFHINRLLLENAYPELERIEEKATRLALDAMKKSVELGAGEEVRQMVALIERHDRFLALDIFEWLKLYEQAKIQKDRDAVHRALERLYDHIIRIHLKFIQNRIDEFKKKTGHNPQTLEQLEIAVPYEPREEDVEAIAEQLLQIKEQNIENYEDMHEELYTYLNGWRVLPGRHSYLYDQKRGEVVSYYQEEKKIEKIIANVEIGLDRFYDKHKRFPTEEEFKEMEKGLPELPLGKKYKYADGKVSAED